MLTGQDRHILNFRCHREGHIAGIVGDAGSSCSIPMARVLGLYRYPQLLHYVQDVHFKDSFGTKAFFDGVGNPAAQYDIVQWQGGSDGTIHQRTVGHYTTSAPLGKNLQINSSAIQWPITEQVPASECTPRCAPGFRKASKEGDPICCFLCVQCPQGEIANQTDSVECSMCPWDQWADSYQKRCIMKPRVFLSYEDPLGASLAAISIFLSAIPASIFALFFHSRATPIVKANHRWLSYLLLLSLTLVFLSSMAFIGYPTTEKCLLRQVAFGIIFALCVSCILAKTIMVVLAFSVTKPNSDLMTWFGPKMSYMVVIICTLIQGIVCTFWLSLFPPFPEYNINTQPGILIIECNEGSSIAFWCMLGYLGLLATTSFMLAFLARKLPDSFNETKYITFSMLAFLSVWLSFFPAYLSTKGKYMVAMEIFAILSSSSSLMSCIFFPKCYIILLRTEMNTREYLMGRNPAKKRKTIAI
ncbi:vomeronasal type-2 receptor 26-like [Lissotriton helveticus]